MFHPQYVIISVHFGLCKIIAAVVPNWCIFHKTCSVFRRGIPARLSPSHLLVGDKTALRGSFSPAVAAIQWNRP